MINLTIYLKKDKEVSGLIKHLIHEKFIIMASVDVNNIAYKVEDEELTLEYYSVITAQTKALLFMDIAAAIERYLGEETMITATPIVASNQLFETTIRANIRPA